MCLWTCAPKEESDHTVYLRRLIRIFTWRILDNQGCKVSSCGQRELMKLRSCTGSVGSSLGAHVSRYKSSRCNCIFRLSQSMTTVIYIEFLHTVMTLCIGTDKPGQTVMTLIRGRETRCLIRVCTVVTHPAMF